MCSAGPAFQFHFAVQHIYEDFLHRLYRCHSLLDGVCVCCVLCRCMCVFCGMHHPNTLVQLWTDKQRNSRKYHTEASCRWTRFDYDLGVGEEGGGLGAVLVEEGLG